MKKRLLILLYFFTLINCTAQIIAVEDFANYQGELPDGAYIKDVNNVLNKYTGVWKGNFDNKSYEFHIIKFTENSILNYKEDILLMRYKITHNETGNIMVNTLSLANDDKYVIKGNYLDKTGTYVLDYLGLQGECGQNGSLFVSINNNKMNLGLYVDGEIYPECINKGVEQILPTSWIYLTKQ